MTTVPAAQEVLAEGLPNCSRAWRRRTGRMDDRVEPPDSKGPRCRRKPISTGSDARIVRPVMAMTRAPRSGHDHARDVPAGTRTRGDRVPRPQRAIPATVPLTAYMARGGDRSQRHTHGPHCARRSPPFRVAQADGPSDHAELGECACHRFPIASHVPARILSMQATALSSKLPCAA